MVQTLQIIIRITIKIISQQRTGLSICTKITSDVKLKCNPRSTKQTLKSFNLKQRKRELIQSVWRLIKPSILLWTVPKLHLSIYWMIPRIKFIIITIKKNLVIWLFMNSTRKKTRNREISSSKSTEMKVWLFNQKPLDLIAQLGLRQLALQWRILPKRTRTMICIAKEVIISPKLRREASYHLDTSEL